MIFSILETLKFQTKKRKKLLTITFLWKYNIHIFLKFIKKRSFIRRKKDLYLPIIIKIFPVNAENVTIPVAAAGEYL